MRQRRKAKCAKVAKYNAPKSQSTIRQSRKMQCAKVAKYSAPKSQRTVRRMGRTTRRPTRLSVWDKIRYLSISHISPISSCPAIVQQPDRLSSTLPRWRLFALRCRTLAFWSGFFTDPKNHRKIKAFKNLLKSPPSGPRAPRDALWLRFRCRLD